MRRAYFPIDVIHTFYGLLGRLADDGSPRRCATRHDDHKTKRHVIAGVTFQSGVIKCPHLSSPSNTLRIFLSFFCCWYLLNISMGLEIDGAKKIYIRVGVTHFTDGDTEVRLMICVWPIICYTIQFYIRIDFF